MHPILLIDESLTVQKVVALTLDKLSYSLSFARNRAEALRMIREMKPELVLLSDQVSDITTASFPREAEALLAKEMNVPPFVLISGQEVKNAKNFVATIKKPFSPQELQQLVSRYLPDADDQDADADEQTQVSFSESSDEDRLQTMFDRTFADEAQLVKETLEGELMNKERSFNAMPKAGPPPSVSVEELWHDRPIAETRAAGPRISEPLADLWTTDSTASQDSNPSDVLGQEESMAFKQSLQSKVEDKLKQTDLAEIVEKVLEKVIPPIVERIVQERLDKLLQDQEQFVETKA